MPNKTIYIKSLDTWQRFSQACAIHRVSVSACIEEMMAEYVGEHEKDQIERIKLVAELLMLSGKHTQEEANKLATGIVLGEVM